MAIGSRAGYNQRMRATITLEDDNGEISLLTEFGTGGFDCDSPAHRAAQALMSHMDVIAAPIIDADEPEIVIATEMPRG